MPTLTICALALIAATANADVRLPALFSDHMVLQRDAKCPVWGTATAGEEVTITIAGQHVVTKADANGRWRIDLAPMPAGGPHTLKVAGNTRVTIKDVLVGEVWVCSGQSNMEYQVRRSNNAAAEIAAAKFPRVRLFHVAKRAAAKPQMDVKASWKRCSPATIAAFTAVGYYFGRSLHASLHDGLDRVPVGLVHTSWGGTRVEAWTSDAGLRSTEEGSYLVNRWNARLEGWPERKKRFDAKLAKWEETAAVARRAGKRPPARPRIGNGPNDRHRPGNLARGMLQPLVPYAIRGAIWYQGESNVGRAYQYRSLFRGMILDWRKMWNQGDFPFLFVQLPNYKVGKRNDPRTWAELREAQTLALALPRTAMAVTIDIGNTRDIHPRNKHEVGRRLALAARAQVYGERVAYSGPMYVRMQAKDGALELTFAHAEGLRARGKQLIGFTVAGEDQQFHPAIATIAGDQVVVHSNKVKSPVAARYGWLDDPKCNLFNSAGLPASPFRTDDWPGVTINKR